MLEKIKNYFNLYSDRKSDFEFAATDIVTVDACRTIFPSAKIEIEDLRLPRSAPFEWKETEQERIETRSEKTDDKTRKDDNPKPQPNRYRSPRPVSRQDAKEDAGEKTAAEKKDNESVPKWETGRFAAKIDPDYFGRETLGKRVTKRVTKFSGLWQWFALFAGVTIQPFFQNYQASHQWIWEGISGWTFFALITSFVIFPAVYKNAFDPEKPVMVQLAPIFTAGLGWHSLLATALKAAK